MNASSTPSPANNKENVPNNLNLPPKGKSPKRFLSRRLSTAVEIISKPGAVCHSKRISNIGGFNCEATQDAQSPRLGEMKEIILDSQPEPIINPRSARSIISSVSLISQNKFL